MYLEVVSNQDSGSVSSRRILSNREFSVTVSHAVSPQHKEFSIFGLLVLCTAVLGGASMPPFINLYGDISTYTKNLWRCQMNFVISIPLVAQTLYSESSTIDFNYIFSLKGTVLLIMSGVVFTGACGTFIASAWLTISSHTLILGALAGVIIIIFRVFTCGRVHELEQYGTLAVLVGCSLLMMDGGAQKAGGQEISIWGEILAISSSVFYALFFPLNRVLITRVPGIIIFMYTAVSSCIWFLIINIAVEGINPSEFFPFDPQVGFFGWLSSEHWMVSIFLVAPFWGLLGNGGYIFSLKYFEPHIVGNAFLLEPVIGQLLGCLLGQDEIPGILTFVGAAIIASGIYTVAQGSRTLAEKIENEIEESELSIQEAFDDSELIK